MNLTISLILAATFVGSVLGLFLLVWAISMEKFGLGQQGSNLIFEKGEQGHTDDPLLDKDENADCEMSKEIKQRTLADQSGAPVVLFNTFASIFWLCLGSLFGLIASLKMHLPDWLVTEQYLTFGILRPMHLNAVAYGWVSVMGIAIALWLVPRLFKTTLKSRHFALVGSLLWNVGVAVGLFEVSRGNSTGVEWLEFPWYASLLLSIAGALIAISVCRTVLSKPKDHLYVSVWYLIAAFIWFPFIFTIANFPGLFKGVEHAITNWWFAHNVLGLWLTPLGLAVGYYLIPKIVGKPIYSYNLSLLGFWGLALFYSQAGIHHLIGGPVPTWLVTLSIVQSVMMVIPVVAVAINYSMTIKGNVRLLLISPTLRFLALGGFFYIAASFQGSIQALRSFNQISHFTHYTVAHAHLGVYGFVSMMMFGAAYYILPRITRWEWPYPSLISTHFWLAVIGFMTYFISLTVGGYKQGLEMLDVSLSFSQIVKNTLIYLEWRSIGGALMTLSHIVFAIHAVTLALKHQYGEKPAFVKKLEQLKMRGPTQ